MKTILFFIILITQLLNCQKMDKEDLAFHVQISHTDNKYVVTPVFDKIITLETIPINIKPLFQSF